MLGALIAQPNIVLPVGWVASARSGLLSIDPVSLAT